ncbi:MAG: type I restriction enzyme R subunit [Rubritalea sp.]|jgi:type I restriction enzyme R subunit
MNKKDLSETDIRTKFITPAIKAAGWDIQTQILEEYSLTKGRIRVFGNHSTRGEGKTIDYVLFYKPNIPIAIIEAKNNKHSIGAGMQQAMDYAKMMPVPFVFSANGDGFVMRDLSQPLYTSETNLTNEEFPSPEELWERWKNNEKWDDDKLPLISQDFHSDGSGKKPRYYQLNAINRTIDAVARGQQRIMLVMATGTGKTYTALQIIWRLWKSKEKKRVLFLADRNILIDQTMVNDFRPLGDSMAKLSTKSKTIERNDGTKVSIDLAMTKSKGTRSVDTSREIYLGLYQALTGPKENQKVYKQFSPEFFDLIIIDECHRGSANEDSEWHEILEYFSGATQVGLTATPKESKDVSNAHYFGEPIYTYSLKQGIDDGFLAPYKVIRPLIDIDAHGYRPESGETDVDGNLIEDREYNAKDFDRKLIIDDRTELVAKKITQFLTERDTPFAKTIVFCENIDHAERMRQALVNENPEHCAVNAKYVMRITGDNPEGKAELDNFIDPESTYPVIATTSKLMTTGVDAQTCQLIVLDRTIKSMTEFKQIIGRGTRINEEHGKTFFTIIDFRKATELFADPDFDGDPVQIYEPKENDPINPPEIAEPTGTGDDPIDPDPDPIVPGSVYEPDGFTSTGNPGDGPFDPNDNEIKKYRIRGIDVNIISERVQFLDSDGTLITTSLKDYTKKTVAKGPKGYQSLDQFLQRWTAEDQKTAIINELSEQGLILDALSEKVGKDYDAFDLICHVAFDQPALTRSERAKKAKLSDVYTQHSDQAKAVLDALLEKYADNGLEEFDTKPIELLRLQPISQMGRPLELIKLFGNKQSYLATVKALENALYAA